ncbi:Uncharacterised protein [Mycobacteroides abscessus subsp. abscessus]|nr:Uncharacterised protein [Mycobacteroides abscessus subsp. abscessus]SLI32773.1 Uncharacterised protein [Mycobacteroides abscessus subsp. abscessus]
MFSGKNYCLRCRVAWVHQIPFCPITKDAPARVLCHQECSLPESLTLRTCPISSVSRIFFLR